MTDLDNFLLGHWELQGDARDRSGHGLDAQNHGVSLDPDGARFDGAGAYLEIAHHPVLQLGRDPFTVTAWVRTDATNGDVVGDIVSKFDHDARRGFHLGVVTNGGVTSAAQSNYRHLHFGIDDGRLDATWTDHGRPGQAVMVTSLTASRGELYAGTFELEENQQGHLWRWAGGQRWTDLGATPDGSNKISSAVEFDGALYCATGRYNPTGSRLGEPRNTRPGGRVYRVEPGQTWIDCGHPGAEDATPEEDPIPGYSSGKADCANSLTVYRGELYVTSIYRKGAFKYEGGTDWKYIGPDARLMTFAVYRGNLFTLPNGGPVLRYQGGTEWTDCGSPAGARQIYSAVIHQGCLYLGTWPNCEVFRYEGGTDWTGLKRIGYEMEVMAMALYNGSVYLGTLPMANVWRMDPREFTLVGNLDNTPVMLRRVWSMAVHDGRLYAGTLPAGHVWSLEAGKLATWDQVFPAGWHHLAAVRAADRLFVYLDGQRVSVSSPFCSSDYRLDNRQPLKIGFGPHESFQGSMRDVRLYGRALGPEEVPAMVRAG